MIPFLIIILLLFIGGYLFLSSPIFGNPPSGKALELIKASPNYQKGKFQNLVETKMSPPGVSYFTILREFLKSHPRTTPTHPLPSIKRNLKTPLSPPSTPVITWFGHSSYLLQIAGKNILVDPVFSKAPTPLQFIGSKAFDGTTPYTINDLPAIDYIILTHDHYDHLDYRFIKAMGNKPQAYITALGVGSHLRSWGITGEKITELDWWQSFQLDDSIQLHAAPARHFSGRGLTRDTTLWCSFVFMADGYNIFIGGDSGYEKHFKEIGDRFGPFDLAILECGQYHHYWPYIHMMPEENVQAALDLRAALLLPVHWGKFKLSMHPWDEPVERLLKEAGKQNVRVITPMIGEAFSLNEADKTTPWWRNMPK